MASAHWRLVGAVALIAALAVTWLSQPPEEPARAADQVHQAHHAVGTPGSTAAAAAPASHRDDVEPDPPGRRDPHLPYDALARIREGIARREYRASRNAHGLQAPNRRQGFRTYFELTGIRVAERTSPRAGDLLAMRWSSVGRGDELDEVPPGELSADGPHVELRRTGLVEWYDNSPAGLEQGFRLTERPAGDGPLVLELALDGAKAHASGDGLRLASAAGRERAYGKLAVTDAAKHAVTARLAAPSADRIRIEVDDAGAVYPLVIDPLLTETADAEIDSNQSGARLGYSVAGAGDVNGDGYADVIVGASFYDDGESNEGAAFGFDGGPAEISGTSPLDADAKLESNQASSSFDSSVAGAGDVNGDGYADVIVAANHYSNGETYEGAAFVFYGGPAGITRTSPADADAQLESNQANAYRGRSVAGAGDVNGDGYDDVIVGSLYDAGAGTSEGAAFVFHGSALGITGTSPADADAQLQANQAGRAACPRAATSRTW